MVPLLAILVAVLVFCGYLLFDKYMSDRKRKESLRARIAPDGSTMHSYEEAPVNLSTEPSPNGKMLLNILKALGINTEIASRALELRFARAGIKSPDAPAYYLFFERVGSFVFVIIAAALASFSSPDEKLMNYSIAGLVIVLAIFGPRLYVQNMIDKRKKVLMGAFPDTLDLLLICVESGLALDAALSRVCTELGRAYPVMTEELNRTRLELSLLNDRVRALMNLGERTDMVAFRSLISALIQSERFGTSLTDTLRVLSEEFRILRLSKAEEKAARLPVMMTVPLMLLLMPALFIIILGPAIVNISNTRKEFSRGK